MRSLLASQGKCAEAMAHACTTGEQTTTLPVSRAFVYVLCVLQHSQTSS